MCRKGQRVREYSTERTHNGAIMRRWPSPVRCSVAELRWGSGTLPHGSAACPVAGADLDVIQCVVFLHERSPPSEECNVCQRSVPVGGLADSVLT